MDSSPHAVDRSQDSALEAQKRTLRELETKGFVPRSLGYLKFTGPGYLQSAMTLGGGTLSASIVAGAAFGYQLLWVAPLGMLIGVLMLAAISHQTLSTGMRPFDAMRRFAGAPLAFGWAIGSLLASVIWHFPQYALGAAMMERLTAPLGFSLPSWLWAAVILAWAIAMTIFYGGSGGLIALYEKLLKYMVWIVVACFAWAVIATGIDDWGKLARGFFTFAIPGESKGITGIAVVIGAGSAAVGINMVFLYPYSLLSKGWGREHRRLARFDLVTGMFIPFTLATSLIIIATANSLYADPNFVVTKLSPAAGARALAEHLGSGFGPTIFFLGVLAMALSTISLHMVTSGFICCELFGWKVGSTAHRLSMLIPAPGFLGAVLWSGSFAFYLATITSIVCGFLLPIAYLGFIRLQTSRAYLKDDLPRGPRALAWLLAMIVATLVVIAGLVFYVQSKLA